MNPNTDWFLPATPPATLMEVEGNHSTHDHRHHPLHRLPFGTMLLAVESLNHKVSAADPASTNRRRLKPVIRPIGPLNPPRNLDPMLGAIVYADAMSRFTCRDDGDGMTDADEIGHLPRRAHLAAPAMKAAARAAGDPSQSATSRAHATVGRCSGRR